MIPAFKKQHLTATLFLAWFVQTISIRSFKRLCNEINIMNVDNVIQNKLLFTKNSWIFFSFMKQQILI